MKFPRGITEKSLPCDLQRNQHRGWRTSKLRKSKPGVGCGYELLAANPQSAHEAGCEIGEGGGDCDLGGPVPLNYFRVVKTEQARARLRARACRGSALAELGDGAPKLGADLLHAVVLGPAVRRCIHGLAGFL